MAFVSEFLSLLFDLLRHLGDDEKWRAMLNLVGTPTLYITMFAVIFCETGLVVTPFLPGDSLLFALGAMAARDIGINLPVMAVLLTIAAVLGDAVNYWIGYKIGPMVFKRENSRLLNKNHLLRSQAFYEKYGSKTIVLARFLPIVRTFAPFVAGIGKMNYFRFALYNVVGGTIWVCACLLAGYCFGGIELVKKHFELVVIVIVLISVLPMAIELWRARRAAVCSNG